MFYCKNDKSMHCNTNRYRMMSTDRYQKHTLAVTTSRMGGLPVDNRWTRWMYL